MSYAAMYIVTKTQNYSKTYSNHIYTFPTCLATYVYLNFPLLNRESAAHGNFHFIGPGLTVMCQSIKEKVLSLSDDSKIRTIKKG